MNAAKPFQGTSILKCVLEFVTDCGERIRAEMCGGNVYLISIHSAKSDAFIFLGHVRTKFKYPDDADVVMILDNALSWSEEAS